MNRALCQGRQKCLILASNSLFEDNCPDTFKYLEVRYHCRSKCHFPKPPFFRHIFPEFGSSQSEVTLEWFLWMQDYIKYFFPKYIRSTYFATNVFGFRKPIFHFCHMKMSSHRKEIRGCQMCQFLFRSEFVKSWMAFTQYSWTYLSTALSKVLKRNQRIYFMHEVVFNVYSIGFSTLVLFLPR